MTFPSCWKIPDAAAVFEVRISDGMAITVRRHGNPRGHRLVISHGNGLSIDAYYPFWSKLTQRFDCFVYDLRNHGWNPVGDRYQHHIPAFVDDNERILRAIEQHFGKKPITGVFHSISAVSALRQAAEANEFAALVLFDPPFCPSGGLPRDMENVGAKLAQGAGRRRVQFENPAEYASRLSRNAAFERVSPGVIDLIARTTLRRSDDGMSYELRCPREYEAQIYQYVYCWAVTADFERVACPMQAIGADPTVMNSYLPSIDIRDLNLVNYDFVPDTTHLLQLEEPEICVRLAIEFLETLGLAL